MSGKLRVGIIMGSDSDLEVMQHVGRALNVLGLKSNEDYEERIISAHRTPHRMAEYAADARNRGLKVIVAGAGGSAHLPGMVASETLLPVLGVAITSSPDTLNRALGSLIGMPEGKPLASFQGKAGAFNAGLFAGRLLLLDDAKLEKAYAKYEVELERSVIEKDAQLRGIGAQAYLHLEP
jgi:5-(carboxyamino)imidazole ribonucleotide mutase